MHPGHRCGSVSGGVRRWALDEVIAVRRLFGKLDYLGHGAVADAEAFEAFQMSELISLPAVARAVSHRTMKRLEG